MLRKLEKLRRYFRWRMKPGTHAPVFWHVGRPNFGDDINPSFLERMGRKPLRLATDRNQPHVLGIGSILEFATPNSTVLGSGYLRSESGPLPQRANVISVRGKLSRDRAGCSAEVLLGDPLVLVDLLLTRPVAKRHRMGLVAHALNVAEMKSRFGREVHVVSPAWDPWRVVEEIASCELIASQSLHGLIVADALQIPNLWIAPSESMAGGRFKFDDYFSTLDQPKEPIAATSEVFRHPEGYPLSVCRYQLSKCGYAAALADAIDRFPANQPGITRRAA